MLNYFLVHDGRHSSAGINERSVIKKLFRHYIGRSAREDALDRYHNGTFEKNNKGKFINNLPMYNCFHIKR